MIATFNDLQDKQNMFNGSTVRNEQELEAILLSLGNRQPFFFELVGDNGFTLLVGYSPDVGCIQHSRSDGGPPYSMGLFMELCKRS